MTHTIRTPSCLPAGLSRRDILRAMGAGALALSPFGQAAQALAAESADNNRILVILELSGGNDGLNTLVPYGDDAYYRHRPKIGIKPEKLRRIDDHFGFQEGMAGFERLYKDGQLALVHGCGYDRPSFSHFVSMTYWHTAAPNSGEPYGWVGRLADAMDPNNTPNYLVNIDASQSLAVRSRSHIPVVFDDPERFDRKGLQQEQTLLNSTPEPTTHNASQRFLHEVAHGAQQASALVRDAWDKYRSPVDYGLVNLDLPKVAALIEADMPTRLYYTSFRNNAFDTHVYQNSTHARLLTYASDAVAAFLQDMERIGRADDVVLLAFSEFGRRVPENTNLGTDHGTANPMFIAGRSVKGGHYGALPSLTELDEGDNLIFTTDFRRVYASVIENWLGYNDSSTVLHGTFEPFALFS
ncbi:MAG: DUF1501 domain-containing protein [Candidatus Competibacteraceae bacterium]|nr:DUF1501 domain-containing protein [Candidatus Competibacteraceae bacterium]